MERKSPKFYVADGIVLRMREAIAYVIDHIEYKIKAGQSILKGAKEALAYARDEPMAERKAQTAKATHVRSLKKQTFSTLDSLHYAGIITENDGLELKLHLSALLNKDEEDRAAK